MTEPAVCVHNRKMDEECRSCREWYCRMKDSDIVMRPKPDVAERV